MGTPTRPTFSRSSAKALVGAGLTGIHGHDLRDTGNHFAAISAVFTWELMGRVGPISANTALAYRHRTAAGMASAAGRRTPACPGPGELTSLKEDARSSLNCIS